MPRGTPFRRTEREPRCKVSLTPRGTVWTNSARGMDGGRFSEAPRHGPTVRAPEKQEPSNGLRVGALAKPGWFQQAYAPPANRSRPWVANAAGVASASNWTKWWIKSFLEPLRLAGRPDPEGA